ncbi:MAG: iron uptake porin [Cyanobacteria bacterium P01_A01_bin.135]
MGAKLPGIISAGLLTASAVGGTAIAAPAVSAERTSEASQQLHIASSWPATPAAPQSPDSQARSIGWPHLEDIRAQVPADWALRLPSHLPEAFLPPETGAYHVRVFAFDDPKSLHIGFFHCSSGAQSCLVSSLTVDSAASPQAQRSWQRYAQQGNLVPVINQLPGYRLAADGATGLVSLMWQQDDLIYTLSGPPQSGLTEFARLIAQGSPVDMSPRAIAATPVPDPLPLSAPLPQRDPAAIANGPQPSPSIAPEPAPTLTQAAPTAVVVLPQRPAETVPTPEIFYEAAPLIQVTSVSSLSDVQPTDWAFEALRSLISRYGCISGFPDGTFRGEASLTRYEFAAGLNACLASITANLDQIQLNQQDAATLSRLQEQFEGELAAIAGSVDSLESRTAALEAQQFSTTVKLFGQSIFGLVLPAGGDPPGLGNSNLFFAHQTQFNLIGSLGNGADFFRVGLSTGNFDNGGAAGPAALNTNMALLSFQTDTDNDIELSALEYRFATFDDRVVFTIKPVGFSLSSVLSSNSPISNAGQEVISRFAEESPLFKIGSLETGIGADWLIVDRLRLQVAYGSRNAAVPGRASSGVDDDHNALGVQLLFTPFDRVIGGLTYVYGFAEDGRLDTATGSFNADISGGFNQFSRIHAVGASLQWQLFERLVWGAWGGLIYTESMESSVSDGRPRAGVTTFGTALRLADPFGREGDVLGLFFGQPPKLVGGDQITPDDATALHFEAFYRFRLNDNISLTPGIFYVTNPGHIEDNDDIVVGTMRTTFEF